MTEISPGRAAYEAYALCSNGRSLVSGAPLPSWDEQRPEIREAWDAAAMAATEAAAHESSMWEQAYMEVQSVLNEALGSGEDDGAGAGIAADVALVVEQRDKARELVRSLERIITAWTRGMYAAQIDCRRGDPKSAISILSEGLDGYDGPEWDGKETGTEWWERTKAEEGL
jgi:hypothetical protein